MQTKIQPFFHPNSNTFCYVLCDEKSNKGVIIDSCLDFDIVTGRTNTAHADMVISYVKKESIKIENGHAHLPNNPGLGIELDWDFIENTTFKKI